MRQEFGFKKSLTTKQQLCPFASSSKKQALARGQGLVGEAEQRVITRRTSRRLREGERQFGGWGR